jgi:methionyl-tRNA formyltransferase
MWYYGRKSHQKEKNMSKKTGLRVMITGRNESALHAISCVHESPHEIVLAVLPKSKETSKISALCDKLEISHCITSKVGLAKAIRMLKPDVLVSAPCPWILPRKIWGNTLCLNVHASLLPKLRGPHPINWALINGEVETGVTVHLIDRLGVDNGLVVLQQSTPIESWDTARTLRQRLAVLGGSLIVDTLNLIEAGGEGGITCTEQNEEEATRAPKRTPKMGRVDWPSLTARQAYNLIRALVDPYPNAFCTNPRTGNRVEFQGARVMAGTGNEWGEPGEVLGVKAGGKYLLAAKEGTLLVVADAKLVVGDILE